MGEGADPDDMLSSGSGNKMISNSDLERQLTQNQFLSQNPLTSEKENTNDRNEKINDHNRDSTADRFSSASEGGGPKMIRSLRTCSSKHIVFHDEVAKKYGEAGLEVYADVSTDDSDPGSEPESEEELGIKSAGEGLQPRGKNNSSAKTTSSRKDQQNINPDHANSSDDEDYKKLVENWRSEQQKLVQQLQNNSLTNVLKLKKINPQALLGEIETTIPADVKKQLKAKLRTMKRNAKNKIMFEQAHRRAPVGNTRLNSVLANIEKRLGEKGIAGADYSSNIVRKTKTGGNKRAAHHEKRAGFKYDLDDGFINDDSDEGGNVKETQKTFSDIESDDKNKSSDDGGEGGKKAKKRKKMKNKNNDETTGGTVSGAVGSRLSSGKKKFAEDFDDLADKKNTTKNENDNDDSEQDQNSDMNSSSDTEDVDSEEERAKLREKQRFKELEKARKLDPAKFRICLPEDPWDFLLDEKELEKIGESAEYQKLQKNSVTSMLQNDLKLVVCGVKDRDEWEKLHLSPASTNLALFQKSNLKPLAFIRRWLEQAVLTNGVPNMEDSFLQQIELPFIPDRNKPFCLATYVRRNLNTIIRSKFDSKILWRWEKAVAEDIRTNWWRFDEDVISLPNPAILTEREEELWCDFIYKLGREAARTALNAQKRVFSTTWHQFVKIWLKCGDEELKLACREYSAPVLRLFKEKCLMNEIWLMHLRNFSHMQALGGKLQSIQYQESRREQYKRLAFGALLVRKLWLAFRRAIKMMHAHNYGEMPRKNHTPGWHGDKLFELFVNTLQHHWLSECEEKIVKGQMFALVDLGPTILRREFDSHNAAVALAERNKTSSMAQQQNFATGTGAPPAPNPSSSDDELLNSEKITTATMGELRPPMPLCGKLFVLAKEAEEQYTMQLSMMSQEEELRIQKQLQRAGLQKPMNLAGNEEGRSVDIIVGDGNKDPSLHENNKTTGSGAATGAASALVSKKKLPAKANRVLPAKGKAAPGKAKGVVVSGSSAGGDGAATSAGPGILQQPAGGTTATGTVITGTTVQQGVLKPPPPLGTASAAGSTNTNAANAAAMHMQPPGGAGSTTFPLPNLPFPAAPQTPGHQHPMMMHMQQPGGATGFVNPMMSQMPQPQMILQPASGVQQNMQMQMSAGGHQAFLTQQQQYQQQQQMAQQQHMQLQQQQMMQQQHQMQQQYMQQQQQLNAQNIKKSSPPAPVAPSPAEPPRQPQAAGITRAASSSSAASSAVQQVVVPSSHQQRQLQQPQLQPQSQQPARNRTGGAGASSSTTAANSARAAAANPDCVPIPLPCNLSLEFNPSVVGQLRSVLSLERQDVFIKDRKTGHQEAYSSLDEAVQGVYARMPPSERGDLHLAHVNDWCAGWHFWRLVIPPPPDAKEKKTQLKRLALHIADCRNSKLQYPFCTRGEGGKLVRGLDLDNFRQLEMVHPKSQKPAVLEEKRNKMLRKGQKGRGRMGN
ncbi:unnamed protein product [Amoebophrya sp. A120]|nr:unnamed protein product [Amoebophrya sp. A120]|eukprot:GSA120T00026145001.1